MAPVVAIDTLGSRADPTKDGDSHVVQDSSKGGAVETGCSGLHYIIGCVTIQYYPHPLNPLSTAPPFEEYPVVRVAQGASS